jgi:hypothetical protein
MSLRRIALWLSIMTITAATVYAQCFTATYSSTGEQQQCGAYVCLSCCFHYEYDGLCTTCGPALVQIECYRGETYTLHRQLYNYGDCNPDHTCVGGLRSGNPTSITCYYTTTEGCMAAGPTQ